MSHFWVPLAQFLSHTVHSTISVYVTIRIQFYRHVHGCEIEESGSTEPDPGDLDPSASGRGQISAHFGVPFLPPFSYSLSDLTISILNVIIWSSNYCSPTGAIELYDNHIFHPLQNPNTHSMPIFRQKHPSTLEINTVTSQL